MTTYSNKLKVIIKISIFIIVLIISIYNLYSQQKNQKVKISKYNEKNELISFTINTYNEKNLITYSEDFIFYNNRLNLYSKNEFIYNSQTNLIQEEIYRTPHISFIHKYSIYQDYSFDYGFSKNIEKKTVNYINNTIEFTNYYYNANGKLVNEKNFSIINDTKSQISEIEYIYENDLLIEKLEYQLQNKSGVYKFLSAKYSYNKYNKLYEIKVLDENENIESIIKTYYDLKNENIYKKEIYISEIAISDNDMYFERRLVKKETYLYKYY